MLDIAIYFQIWIQSCQMSWFKPIFLDFSSYFNFLLNFLLFLISFIFFLPKNKGWMWFYSNLSKNLHFRRQKGKWIQIKIETIQKKWWDQSHPEALLRGLLCTFFIRKFPVRISLFGIRLNGWLVQQCSCCKSHWYVPARAISK